MEKNKLTLEKINTEKLDINPFNNISLTRIGSLIKEARISKNQTVNELASNVKISEQQLKAIEEGRDDLLPETIFVKAMVKKISEKLKLDLPNLMAEFNDEKEQIIIEHLEEQEEEKDSKKFRSFTLGFIINIIISGVVGFIASSYMLNFLFDINYESEKQTSVKKI